MLVQVSMNGFARAAPRGKLGYLRIYGGVRAGEISIHRRESTYEAELASSLPWP